jgi:leucyl-tRNA---protein transferase
MEPGFRYQAPPSQCGYLADQTWSLEYDFVPDFTAAEYMQRMLDGWRRFGRMLFHPRCPTCQACQSIRVPTDTFRPDRSQRRAARANDGVVTLEVGRAASPSAAKLKLYDRYHAFQAGFKGWPQQAAKDRAYYQLSFIDNPFPCEEWCYYLGSRLVGVGYVDPLPAGLSAIYFFYDPDERQRSLGIWNVLCVLAAARERRLPHTYLGYYVAGSKSMEYKATFRPNEVRHPDGTWRPFRQ